MPYVTATLVVPVSLILLLHTKKHEMYAMLSHVCESMGVRPVNGPDVTRDAFTATCIAKARPTPGHTHPDAAAFRTAATETALNVSSYAGSSIFVIGLSRTDQRRALRGTRAWYWAKDTHTRNQSDNPSSDDFLYICDVDYYIDMPDLLAKNCHPTLIYTVVPEHAATDGVDDTSFHFDEMVYYTVTLLVPDITNIIFGIMELIQ
jgi:hypothetical protein